MNNKKLAIILGIVLLILIISGGAYWIGKNEDKVKFVNFDNKMCDLNKSYNALYSFSSASGPKIDYPCDCPTSSYIMNISSHSGMSVVLGNGGDKTIEYQCVKDFKICPEGYKLTSYSDEMTKERGYPEKFTCTKN